MLSLVSETLELINAERDKPLQAGQAAHRGVCTHHPSAAFPLRATRQGASEDTNNHIHTNGNHTVDIIEIEFTQKDAEALIEFTNTICELVIEWAEQVPDKLDPIKLETVAYKEARSWIADGFSQADYRTGWDCWIEDKLHCRHTYAQMNFESMTAESIMKIATCARHG